MWTNKGSGGGGGVSFGSNAGDIETWAEVGNSRAIPFAKLSGVAASSHTHTHNNITDWDTELNLKADKSQLGLFITQAERTKLGRLAVRNVTIGAKTNNARNISVIKDSDGSSINDTFSTSDHSHNLVLSAKHQTHPCLLYTSPSPRDRQKSRMPSSA